jgi:hypothetical protein
VLADALSRLPLIERQHTVTQTSSPVEPRSTIEHTHSATESDFSEPSDAFSHLPTLPWPWATTKCFNIFNHLDVDAEHPFALDYQTIVTAQDHDPQLQQKLATRPKKYARIATICCIPEPSTSWKICLPTAMLHNTVRWYHMSLNHIDITRTHDTMSMHLYRPTL